MSFSVVKALHIVGLVLKKKGPSIMVGAGIISGVAAGFFACRSTLKLDETLKPVKQDIIKIHDAQNDPELDTYGDKEARHDLILRYSNAVGAVVRLYASTILFGAASIFLILGGHHLLIVRNTAISLALTKSMKALNEYRSRVKNDLGEEKDFELVHGVKDREEIVIEEDGTTTVTTKKEWNEFASPYGDYFTESNIHWRATIMDNFIYLKKIQAQMNDLLRAKGYVFLNEARTALGLKPTQEGQIVGWVDGLGDGYIDFGLDPLIKHDGWHHDRQFVSEIPLDFNVSGPIIELLDGKLWNKFFSGESIDQARDDPANVIHPMYKEKPSEESSIGSVMRQRGKKKGFSIA